MHLAEDLFEDFEDFWHKLLHKHKQLSIELTQTMLTGKYHLAVLGTIGARN